jgi:hypothetical protein
MSRDETDKIFKAKLHSHPATPRPEAWEKIQAKLYPERSRKGIIWFRVVSGMAAVLLVGLVLYNVGRKPEPVSQNPDSQVVLNRKTVQKGMVPEKINPAPAKVTTETGKPVLFEKRWMATKTFRQAEQESAENKTLILKPFLAQLPLKTVDLPTGSIRTVELQLEEELITFDINPPVEKRKTWMGRLLVQLHNFKKGERVDLQQIGVKREMKEMITATIRQKFN